MGVGGRWWALPEAACAPQTYALSAREAVSLSLGDGRVAFLAVIQVLAPGTRYATRDGSRGGGPDLAALSQPGHPREREQCFDWRVSPAHNPPVLASWGTRASRSSCVSHGGQPPTGPLPPQEERLARERP